MGYFQKTQADSRCLTLVNPSLNLLHRLRNIVSGPSQFYLGLHRRDERADPTEGLKARTFDVTELPKQISASDRPVIEGFRSSSQDQGWLV